VFADIALRWAKPGSLIAYLTPTSFLAGQYYSALRGLLAREAPPVAIDFVHARRGVFEDVLQETLLAVYRKGEASPRARIHYLRVANEREAEVKRNGTIGLPADPTSPWLAPRDPEHAALIRRVEAMPTRLADFGYSVSTGPLVWNRFKAQLRQAPDGETVYPLIWAESVSPAGQFAFKALKRNHAPYFKLGPNDDWLLVRDGCVLVQRTTAKEQARRLIAAELSVSWRATPV
jgi:adenine-specific DNA-methyltransferase